MEPVSATIITLNEEARIGAAVASVAWAAEVLVLDCGSDDRTVAVAEEAGARTVVEPWRGYGAQRNRAAELVSGPWVLAIDADERCSDGLAEGIAALPEAPQPVAFRLRRRNHFGEQPIRHWPWWWDHCTRLYDRRRARFSERRVHETLLHEGRAGEVSGVLEHLGCQGWADYRQRQQQYARLGAEELADRGRPPRAGDLTLRPVITFLRHCLGRGYLLGGTLGWRLSLAAARGTHLKYSLLRQCQRW